MIVRIFVGALMGPTLRDEALGFLVMKVFVYAADPWYVGSDGLVAGGGMARVLPRRAFELRASSSYQLDCLAASFDEMMDEEILDETG